MNTEIEQQAFSLNEGLESMNIQDVLQGLLALNENLTESTKALEAEKAEKETLRSENEELKREIASKDELQALLRESGAEKAAITQLNSELNEELKREIASKNELQASLEAKKSRN